MTSPFEKSTAHLERPEKKFEATYKRILNTSVSPENIQTFFDTTLQELVSLVEEVVAKYEASRPHAYLIRADLEDNALRSYGLPDVQETLGAISARGEIMLKLKSLIQAQTHLADEVFVPPTPDAGGAVIPGSGQGLEQKRLIPRLLTLLYILENDLGYDLSPESEVSAHITAGTVTDRMFRQTPYFRVVIKDLKRVVYICEEEGNASYIFDSRLLPIPFDQLDTLDKEALNELIKSHPKVGRRLIQTSAWREKMITYLTQDFSKDDSNSPSLQKQHSDFSPIQNIPKKEGWESAHKLEATLKSATKTIKTFAETFRAEHPEWFEMQRTATIMTEHYHPDLVTKIQERFSRVPQKKEGWETAKSLEAIGNITSPTISKYAETFRAERPEWFEVQKTGSREVEHYHPDLVMKIREHFSPVPQKKEGWETANVLAVFVRADRSTIKEFVESFRKEHPEWFEIQRTGTKTVEHYHPDLVMKTRERFSNIQKKEGWGSMSSLRKLLKVSDSTVKDFAELFRVEHPEWFEIQKTGRQEVEHYHPDLVMKIREHVFRISEKKEGWESAASLRKQLKGDYLTIKAFAETFRGEYPEWFEIQKTRGQEAEHYHPFLVEKIKVRFPSR